MKRLLFFICTLLCANVIMAQDFWEGNLRYAITGAGKVRVYDCSNYATSVNIPSSVTKTWKHYSSSCNCYITDSVKTYSVTSIGGNAFEDCSSLTSVTIPNSVTSIGQAAFADCSSLTSIDIPNSVTSIGYAAFCRCSSLTSVAIPNSVTSIGGVAFSNCSSLTSIDIPNSVTSIENSTFTYCTSLTSITIGNSVTSIGDWAFRECSSLTTLNYNAINCNDFDYYDHPFENCPITTINIGNSVQRIPNNFAYNLDSLTSVNIPNSVTSIGNYAFSRCSSLTSVNIPNSVTSIGDWAFRECSSLTSVNIPNSVNTIGECAFWYCTGLESINLSDNITSIGRNCFDSCINLTTVNIPTSLSVIDTSLFRYCTSLTSVTIPENITDIKAFSFKNCHSLTSINIPNSVTSIGEVAFYECSTLTSVTIGNSVTSIGNYAFSDCSSLTSVTIPNSVTSIGERAFQHCSSLTSFTLGNSITSIGYATFYDCSNLSSINIPNSVTYIGDYAFTDCSSLTSVNIPNSVTSIGYAAFWNCISLTSVTIPNSVTYIGDYAFENCSSLTSVTIPNSVTSIGVGTFTGCSFLQNVTCLATTPPTLADNTVFPYPNIATLTIPCGTLEAYSASNSLWNMFFSGRISENGYNVVATVNDNAFGSVAVESDCSTAMLTATANSGYIFLNWNDGNTENPRLVSLTSDTSFVANFIISTVNTDITATICQGQTYTENGFNVSEAGTYTQTLTAINGADSIVTLTLNVLPIFNTELTATICQGQTYTENNFNVSEAGVYTQTLTSVNGCDSIVTLTLNVLPIFNTELIASICQGQVYNENGFNVSEAGVYTQTLTSANGCDSIVTLTLNVNPIFNTELSATICQGQTYAENGFNVSEAGVYTQTLTSVNGCDSIVTLTLNVNPIFNTELSATICQGQAYTENGFNVSEAGVYTQTLTSVNGCDSIVTLSLNVNPVFNTELSATICQGQVYNEQGFNVSEAGVYTQTLTSANGCDSIVTLTLNVNPIFNTELTVNICEGQVYAENGFNVSEAGTYTQSLQTVNGCDSIVTLTLNVNPTFNTELSANICQGTVYNENGFEVSEAGTYTQSLQTVNGCDSIVTLVVTTYPTFDTIINATINAGETYAEFGFNESEAGTYVQNLQTVNGCDSTITLILDVNSSLMDVEYSELSFYPNPTDSKITFSSTIESIEVIDLTGRCVLTFSNAREINIESLPAGAYYLRLTNNDKAIMRKVIKE